MFEENRRTKLFTLGAICFGLFMVMLDNTVVNLALPTIQRELNAGFSELQWIVDAFTLLLAALMLTGGTLGDIYGRKRAFLSGLVIFTAASLLCALSPTIEILIGGRAVQGLGAAVMMPSTLAILTNTFTDPKERAQAIGIWAGVSGIALAARAGFGRRHGGCLWVAEHLLHQCAHRTGRLLHSHQAGAGVEEPRGAQSRHLRSGPGRGRPRHPDLRLHRGEHLWLELGDHRHL